jgi:tetratricopeptide (TPR) repeat protein
MWTETYDRVLDDIFAVQDDIAKSVATAMNVALLGKPTQKARGNAESYNLVLQGNYFATRITREALEKAASLYQRAIEVDPGDARAWSGLSRVIATQSGYGFTDRADAMVEARAAGEKALALDDTLADAYDILGWLYMAHEFNWKKAGESFRRAYALAPGDGSVLTGLASFEAYSGDLNEALRLMKKSIELDPLDPSAYLYGAKVHYSAGDLETALEFSVKALELGPGITSAHAVSRAVGTSR